MVYKQIAHELSLSTSTVRTHLHNIYGKLGAVDRAPAGLMAAPRGGALARARAPRAPPAARAGPPPPPPAARSPAPGRSSWPPSAAGSRPVPGTGAAPAAPDRPIE